jgi:hypothetical protein
MIFITDYPFRFIKVAPWGIRSPVVERKEHPTEFQHFSFYKGAICIRKCSNQIAPWSKRKSDLKRL